MRQRKLTMQDASRIRYFGNLYSQRELAKRYGVSQSLISQIQRRRIYKEPLPSIDVTVNGIPAAVDSFAAIN